MNITLILIFGGLTLGCATVGVIGLYMLFSRPYRKARNRLAILLGQVFVAVSALTSLVMLQKLEQVFSVVRHSSAFYSRCTPTLLACWAGSFLC
jgi:multisubunit Na+/H+ antiporter MnhB subunit